MSFGYAPWSCGRRAGMSPRFSVRKAPAPSLARAVGLAGVFEGGGEPLRIASRVLELQAVDGQHFRADLEASFIVEMTIETWLVDASVLSNRTPPAFISNRWSMRFAVDQCQFVDLSPEEAFKILLSTGNYVPRKMLDAAPAPVS